MNSCSSPTLPRRSAWRCRLASLSLLATLVAPLAHASVASDIADARAAWVAQDLATAQAKLASALAQEPSNDEANALMAFLKLAALVEQPEFAQLATQAGVQGFVGDVFGMRGEIAYYQEEGQVWTGRNPWYSENLSGVTADAARSGGVGYMPSEMSAQVSGAGELSFKYNVLYYGKLSFIVDGETLLTTNATNGWLIYTTMLDAGDHTLVWRYELDDNGSAYDAYVDALTFPGYTEPATITEDLNDALDLAANVTSRPAYEQALIDTSTPIFAETFTLQHVADYINADLRPTLAEISTHLAEITDPTFILTLNEDETMGDSVEADYADMLVLRAFVEGASAFTGFLAAHELPLNLRQMFDFDQEHKDEWDTDLSAITPQWLFANFPRLLALQSNADLDGLEANFRKVAELYPLAANAVFARPGEERYLFNKEFTWADPDTRWYAQTIVTHDGVDAVQSGSIQPMSEEHLFGNPKLKFPVSGPGTLSFWYRILPGFQGDFLYFAAYGHFSDVSRTLLYFDNGSNHSYDWQFAEINVPYYGGFEYISLECLAFNPLSVSLPGPVVVDQLAYTPSGGSPTTIQPGANALDTALDISIDAYSDPVLTTYDGLTAEDDAEIRVALQEMLAALDGLNTSGDEPWSVKPFFDGEVSFAHLRPVFVANGMIQGSFPDATFGGILPEMTTARLTTILRSELNAWFYNSEEHYYYLGSTYMNSQETADTFEVEFLAPFETESGRPEAIYNYDEIYDVTTDIFVEYADSPHGPWHTNSGNPGSDPFAVTIDPWEGYPVATYTYEDLTFSPAAPRFYRVRFDFHNGPLTE